MFNESSFVLGMFVTRVALPILFTLLLGGLAERALNRRTSTGS